MVTIRERVWESKDPYLTWLKESKGVSSTTLFHYYSYYKDIKKIEGLNAKNLKEYIHKKKNNTVVRAMVNSLLEFLESEADTFLEFEMPKRKTGSQAKKIVRDYTQEDIEKVRAECYRLNLFHGLLFDLLYYGALRRIEISRIQINSFLWDDFFDGKKATRLRIRGKGKKEREVLIPREVIKKIIEGLIKIEQISSAMDGKYIMESLKSNTDKLFMNIPDGHKVWKIINKRSKKALGKPMRPHEIRHTRATELQDRGVNIRDIQHYLGHSSPQITEIYLHTTAKTSIKHIEEMIY